MIRKLLVVVLLVSISVSGQENIKVSPAFESLIEFDKIRDFTMTQSGNEAYTTIQSPSEEISVIAKLKKGENGWEKPTIASFSGKHRDLEPFLAPDGLKLYFVSTRPLDSSQEGSKDFDIWYVERSDIDSSWSEPVNMGSPVNSEHNEFYPAVAKNGNLYFTCDCPNALGRDDIFMSEYKDGTYRKPQGLGTNVNSEGFEYNAFISPDDSFLLFGGYNREDGQGSGDIYVSYKNASGEWSEAKPLPSEINSKYMDYCPFVDAANQTLYFTSRRSHNPKEGIENLDDLSKFLESYENGNSRLYKAKIDINSLK